MTLHDDDNDLCFSQLLIMIAGIADGGTEITIHYRSDIHYRYSLVD